MYYLKRLVVSFTIIAGFILAGCQSYRNYHHKTFMSGEIVDIKEKEIIFCINDRDKIKIGQEYKAYKKKVIRTTSFGGRNPVVHSTKTRLIETGTVRIIDYHIDHYARAVVVKGFVSKGDIIDTNE